MNIKTLLICFTLLLLIVSPLIAHGVLVQVKKDAGNILVKAQYDAGAALVDVPVTIRFETETMAAYIFLKGKTDHEGMFRFAPEETGTFTITVDDVLGHMGEEVFEWQVVKKKPVEAVSSEKSEKSETSGKSEKTPFEKQDMTKYLLKILLGVALILVITVVLNRLQKKKESQSDQSPSNQ